MSTTPSAAGPRARLIPGAHNLRDLGGLPTRSGAIVRTGRLFRSDYPAFFDLDPNTAAELGLRTVVDLRRGSEAAVECVDWSQHGVTYQRWPLVAGAESSWHARYPAYFTRRPESVVGAVRAAMDPKAHPVLFHCAAGKDRTGIVAALLLAVLGVAPDDIVADYVLSASSVAPVLARLTAMRLYAEMLADSSAADQEPRADYMRSLLGWLDGHGGAEQWLLDRGISVAELREFRQAMGVGE